jgi:uncharacterized membrane protein
MESLLYTISGLPVHALVVHFAVVVLPVAAFALIALIYTPKIKSKYSFITVIGVVLGSAAVLVAKQSGEALSEHIGLPVKHADYGTYLTVAAFILMVLSLAWYQLAMGRRSRVVTPLGHITVLAAVAVLILTFLTGHTGAQAVWEGKLNAPSVAPTTSSSTSTIAGTYTAADLAKHSSKSSCWSAVGGNVYDLTTWIAKHPGGQSVIAGMCGRDATSAFNGQHAGASKPANFLAQYKIGKFA